MALFRAVLRKLSGRLGARDCGRDCDSRSIRDFEGQSWDEVGHPRDYRMSSALSLRRRDPDEVLLWVPFRSVKTLTPHLWRHVRS